MKWVERQEIAEDVVQDLFVQVWERDTIYSSYYGFKNFLYNSVKNASLDYLKHKEVEGKYVRYTLRTSEAGRKCLNITWKEKRIAKLRKSFKYPN